MADLGQRRLLTPLARLSYPAVIESKAVMGDDKKKQFSAELIIEPSDLAKFKLMTESGLQMVDVRSVCATVAREKWGDDLDVEAIKKLQPSEGGLGWPLKDGNVYASRREADGKTGDAYKGKVHFRTKGSPDYPPVLKFLSTDKTMVTLDRNTEMDILREYFTAGNYVMAEVTVKATEPKETRQKYVTIYLNGVCYIRKGERLGTGGSLLDERIDGILGGISEIDPTDGMDEAIPL